jgi:hypothetical protein
VSATKWEDCVKEAAPEWLGRVNRSERRDVPDQAQRCRCRRDPRPAPGGRLPDLRIGGKGIAPQWRSRRAAEPSSAAQGRPPRCPARSSSTPQSIASKRWVFEQYDSTVSASTLFGPGSDAGVLRVGETDFGLAVTEWTATPGCWRSIRTKAGKGGCAPSRLATSPAPARYPSAITELPQLRQPGEAGSLLTSSKKPVRGISRCLPGLREPR